MKILELCAGYPGYNGSSALSYVKVRNHYYREEGLENITILNFSLPSGNYQLDGFEVISLKTYKEKYVNVQFDVLICHAPNIRNHYTFLKKYQKRFSNIVFFFHGHEVLSIKKEYPKPYTFQHNKSIYRFISPIYDLVKFSLWREYFIKQGNGVHLVFVSEWIRNKFEEYVGVKLNELKVQSHLIYNGVSRRFQIDDYDLEQTKKYDFITIRSNIDDPKYAVDVVNNLANSNPHYKFLLVGDGTLFSHMPKAENIEQIKKYLTPDEIVTLLNESSCALMPTKNDTQGIMACEMATFGMPLITSDIDVCKVVFHGFENVAYISNDKKDTNLTEVLSKVSPSRIKVKKFFYENTILKEVELLENLIK